MILRLTTIALTILLFGCEKPQEDERFYFISGISGVEVDYFVNGNPTNRGNALTLFLVDGQNTLRLKGNDLEDGYHLQVFRGLSIFDAESEKIVEKRQDATKHPDDGVVTFEADISHQWAWQKAELLGELSAEDKTAITTIYDAVCAEIEGDDFEPKELLSREDVVLWSESREHSAMLEKLLEESGAKIPPRSELVFQVATHDELRLISGKQIAMLICDHDKLVYLGPRENEEAPESGEVRWSFYYGFSEMFFAKFGNSWKLLIPNL